MKATSEEFSVIEKAAYISAVVCVVISISHSLLEALNTPEITSDFHVLKPKVIFQFSSCELSTFLSHIID